MGLENLSVNQDIDLEVKKGPYKGSYESRVADIKDEVIEILTPYREGNLVPLRQGLEVVIFFAGETAAFKFITTVENRRSEPVPVLCLGKPEEDDLVKIQRRNHFRLEARKKVWYRALDDDWEPVEEEFSETHTLDISGGGVKMLVPRDYEVVEGDFLELKLDIEEIEEVPIISEVVNKYNRPNIPDKKPLGIQFVDIDRNTRDLLMGWMFEYQRKLRRKGLL